MATLCASRAVFRSFLPKDKRWILGALLFAELRYNTPISNVLNAVENLIMSTSIGEAMSGSLSPLLGFMYLPKTVFEFLFERFTPYLGL